MALRKTQKAKMRQTAPASLENSQSSSSAAQLDLSQLHEPVTTVLAFNEVGKVYNDGSSFPSSKLFYIIFFNIFCLDQRQFTN